MFALFRGWDSELSYIEARENAELLALHDREAVARVEITIFPDGAVIEYTEPQKNDDECYTTSVALKEGQEPNPEKACHNAVQRLFREIARRQGK